MEFSAEELKLISSKEESPLPLIKEELYRGRAVILKNALRRISPVLVGRRFKCKVNVNLGTSPDKKNISKEIKKLFTAIEAGADTVMDLSVGADSFKTRARLIENCPLPLGTVPIYSLPVKNGRAELSRRALLEEIERQADQGVDFMTLHSGLLRSHLPLAAKRTAGIVSRGGALIAQYMSETGRENPFYEYFDEILGILKKYSVAASLGDGLRPGCCADASDKAQYAELSVLGKLRKRCHDAGVGAMIEGPGHVPLNLIEENVRRAETETDGAPLYFLGPIIVDNAAGRDHIAGAMGAALAGFYGVSLLCAVTPAEHLGQPGLSDIKEGAAAFKIAAESVNLSRGFIQQVERNMEISRARFDFDWKKQFKLALDSGGAEKKYRLLNRREGKFCSMCGEDFCAIKRSGECLGEK